MANNTPINPDPAPKTLRRILCWSCQLEFRVDVAGLVTAQVIVVLTETGETKQRPKHKLIVKCPYCQKENEVRV